MAIFQTALCQCVSWNNLAIHRGRKTFKEVGFDGTIYMAVFLNNRFMTSVVDEVVAAAYQSRCDIDVCDAFQCARCNRSSNNSEGQWSTWHEPLGLEMCS